MRGMFGCTELTSATASRPLGRRPDIVARIMNSLRTVKDLINLLVFILPVTQSIPVAAVGQRSISVGTDTLLLALIYTIWFIGGRRVHAPHAPRATAAVRGVGVMLGCFLLAFGVTLIQPRAMGQIFDSGLMLIRWFQYVPMIVILPRIFFSVKDIHALVNTITASAVTISIVNAIEYNMFGIDFTVARGATWATKSLFIETAGDNYNISGGYLLIAILLNVVRFTHANDGKRGWGAIIVAIVLLGLLYNTSRSSLLAVMLGGMILVAGSAARMSSKLGIVAVNVALLAAIYVAQGNVFDGMRKLASVFKAVPLLFGDALSPLDMPEHVGSTFMRFSMWNETFKQIAQSPIWGSGLGSLRWRFAGDPLFTADNYYLELMADTGVIGLCIFCFMLSRLYVGRMNRQSYATPSAVTNLLAGWRAIFWSILFINLTGNMFSSQTIWGMFAIIGGVAISAASVLDQGYLDPAPGRIPFRMAQRKSADAHNSMMPPAHWDPRHGSAGGGA